MFSSVILFLEWNVGGGWKLEKQMLAMCINIMISVTLTPTKLEEANFHNYRNIPTHMFF